MSLLPKDDLLARIKADKYFGHRQCKPCGLYEHCTSPFMQGSGPTKTRVLFAGEAPGFHEDQQDRCFVGKAGSFLRDSMRAVGLDPATIRFTNTISCRPPNNDVDFQPKASKYCKDALWAQIQDVDPDIVVLSGNIPLKAVLGVDKITHWSGTPVLSSKVPELHLKSFDFRDTRERVYLPILHPSHVLRTKNTEVEEVTLNRFIRDIGVLKAIYDGEHDLQPRLPPHRVIVDFEEAVAYLKELHNYPRVGYDYETPDLDQYQDYAKILCVSFAPLKKKKGVPEYGREYPWILPKEGVCIPIDHDDSPFTADQRSVLKHCVRDFLFNKNIRIFAWNHPFEYIAGTLLLNAEPVCGIEDPMYAVYSTNEMPGTHGLKYNTRIYTEYGGYEREIEREAARTGNRFDHIPGSKLFPYNAMDSYTMALSEKAFYPRLAEDDQWGLVNNILYPAVRLLARMELQGIQINQAKVVELTSEFDKRISVVVKEAEEMDEVRKAEYKIRELLAVRHKEAEKERSFDAAKDEFRATVAELRGSGLDMSQEDNTITPLAGKVEKIKLHLKTHERGGVKLPEIRVLLKTYTEALRKAKKKSKELTRRVEVLGRRVERTRESYAKTVEKVDGLAVLNLGNDDHVRIVFYDILRFPVFRWTDSGLPSTDDEVLQRYKRRHRFVQLVDAYRQLTKIRSTYLVPLHPDVAVNGGHTVVKPDGKVHSNVKALARTGRLMSGQKGRGKSEESSKRFKFNIQNLARPFYIYCRKHCIDDDAPELAKKCPDCFLVSVRDCFQTSYICDLHKPTAKKGCQDCGRITESDYSGLEAMTLGILAQDEAVLDCIRTQMDLESARTEVEDLELQAVYGVAPEGWQKRIEELKTWIGPRADRADFHKRTASLAYGIPPEKVSPQQRQDCKAAAGFGLLYGGSPYLLVSKMDWAEKTAKEFVEKFWAGYKGIKARNDAEVAFARKHGYVRMITGNRRRLPAIHSIDRGKRGHAEREAMNAGIQGPCSYFNLIAATILDQEFRRRGWKARVVALVHDAIYVDHPFKEGLEVARLMKKIQEHVPTTFPEMTHPLRVERKVSVTMGKG